MKNIFIFLFLIISGFISFYFLPSAIYAQDRFDRVLVIDDNTPIENYYFGFSENIEVRGVINSDIYVFGEKIVVNGIINGDLIAIGGNVRINGEVTRNAIIISESADIVGRINNNLITLSGSTYTHPGSEVMGGILGASGKTQISGDVLGKMNLVTQELIISSIVGGNVDTFAEVIKITKDANVTGGLNYYSNNEATVEPGASVSGTITKREAPKMTMSEKDYQKGRGFGRLIGFLGVLLVGVIFIKLFKSLLEGTKSVILSDFWNVSWKGFVLLLITPMICLLLFLTIIGIPLSLLILIIYLFAIYFSTIIVAYGIGKSLIKFNNDLLSFIVGLICLALITSIPEIGGFLKFIIIIVGLGSLWGYFRLQTTKSKSTLKKNQI